MAVSVRRYTIQELEDFPEDGNRYELLDGVLIVTPQASLRHQTVASELTVALANQIKGEAWVVGPGAVERGNNTHLEPDVLIFPKRFSPNLKWIEVSDHWLVIEVLSPSSRIYDRDIKRDAYLKLGAREVWIVDPVGRFAEVSRKPGEVEKIDSVIRWRVPDTDRIVPIDIGAIFASIG